MREYARQRGLRRLLLPVPVLSPALSSLWLGLVTPLYARVGRKLIDSLRNATVVTNDRRPPDVHGAAPRLPRGDRPGPGQRGPRVRRDPLVGRPVGRRPAAELGGRPLRLAPRRLAGDPGRRAAAGRVRADRAARRSRRAGTPRTRCGACADSSTCWSAGSASAAVAAIRATWSSATRSTSGAWRPSSRVGCSGSPPRCGSLVERGSSSRSNRTARGRSFGRPLYSIPWGSWVSPTGTPSIPSTDSSSAACCVASRARLGAGRDRDANPDRRLRRRAACP